MSFHISVITLSSQNHKYGHDATLYICVTGTDTYFIKPDSRSCKMDSYTENVKCHNVGHHNAGCGIKYIIITISAHADGGPR